MSDKTIALVAADRRRRRTIIENFGQRGLSRDKPARYVGVSAGTFEKLVAARQMPAAKRALTRRLWDYKALEAAFYALPTDFPTTSRMDCKNGN
jgi:hypothetical protein